jgi:hypothetical protein
MYIYHTQQPPPVVLSHPTVAAPREAQPSLPVAASLLQPPAILNLLISTCRPDFSPLPSPHGASLHCRGRRLHRAGRGCCPLSFAASTGVGLAPLTSEGRTATIGGGTGAAPQPGAGTTLAVTSSTGVDLTPVAGTGSMVATGVLLILLAAGTATQDIGSLPGLPPSSGRRPSPAAPFL